MSLILQGLIEKNKIIGKYGVRFLDDYLLGIKKTDFVMIGAPTGTGKSNLAYQIAFDNSEKLNVHLFALEADIDEPYERRLFSEYSRLLRTTEFASYTNYRDFSQGSVTVPKMLETIEKQIMDKYNKLSIHYKEKEFTINTLEERLSTIASGNCDMIILDHVDYFDILTDVNENLQVSNIMKKLREINMDWGIPVILISHLRKKSNRKVIIPDIEDLFGTSNKQKQMKTVILLAPDYENSDPASGIFSTYFSIPKDRAFGATHLVGQCAYNSHIGRYEDEYSLLRITNFGETLDKDIGGKPKWATMGK